ncbi:MAG: acyl-CoA thioesterase [Acidimicrobiia bacterium]
MQPGDDHPCGRAVAPVVVRDDFVRILDTDATGRIYYGAAVGWLGQAAEDLLLPLGIGRVGDPPMAAPVRHLEVFYDGPLCLYDRYRHEAWISHVGTSSFAISHAVWVDGQVRLRGRTTSVHLDQEGKPAPLPDAVRRSLLDVVLTTPPA